MKNSAAKKSLGCLYPAKKTKPRSPALTGTMTIQRHTFAAIAKVIKENGCDEIKCNIAGWSNTDRKDQKYICVELSPPFPAQNKRQNANEDILDEFFGDDGDNNDDSD
jgi:hypothetical protein